LALQYKSYISQVKEALKEASGEICESWGSTIIGDAQLRTPVLTGNLRRSESYQVMSNIGADTGVTNNIGVMVGTNGIPYSIAVHMGDSHHPNPQPFLEDAAMQNIPKLGNIASEKISAHMGGK
jgi:HK97 gp10 family phage protein